ncbi:lytic transglycosylase domain-containing protein [Roseomonas sp. F4]
MTRIVLLLLLILPLFASRAARAEEGLLCRAAIQAAERAAGIPPHLLTAIARIESGRRDPETGAFHPWPWTINAEGRGQFFAGKAAAIAGVQALQAGGMRSIDVGCMQVNLRHHPDAFPSLEAAFDPLTNATYAARFLTELHGRLGDWNRAVAAYHSQTPERGEPYRERVMAAWAREQGQPHAPLPSPSANTVTAAAQPAPRTSGAAMLSNGAERAATVAAPAGTQGRGLDAYRSLPVPIAGRSRGLLMARR